MFLRGIDTYIPLTIYIYVSLALILSCHDDDDDRYMLHLIVCLLVRSFGFSSFFQSRSDSSPLR